MRRSIIAAVDGSEQSTDAARVAAWLARQLDRRLVLAHVADDPPVFPYGDRWLRNAQRRRSGRTAAEFLDGVADEIGEPDARRRIALRGPLYGNVIERLRGLCREERADLVVVGTRARGRFTRALLGSSAARLARDAIGPVAVVPQDAAPHLLETAPGRIGRRTARVRPSHRLPRFERHERPTGRAA